MPWNMSAHVSRQHACVKVVAAARTIADHHGDRAIAIKISDGFCFCPVAKRYQEKGEAQQPASEPVKHARRWKHHVARSPCSGQTGNAYAKNLQDEPHVERKHNDRHTE